MIERSILTLVCAMAITALSCVPGLAECAGGRARLLSGSDWIVGETTKFEVEYTAGPGGVPVGGAVAVAFIHALYITPSTAPNSVGYVKVARESGENLDVKYVEWPPKMWPPTETFPLALDRSKNDYNLRHGVFAKVVDSPIKPGEKVRFVFGADGKGIVIPRTVCDKPIRVAVDLKGDGKYYAIDDVPDCRIVAGPVHHLIITVPSTRTIGEDADICIRAEDESTNLAVSCNMQVKLSGIPGLPENPVQIENGLARIIVPVSKDGVIRVNVVGNAMSARSNPMVVSAKHPQYNVYWGDIHGHTSLSDGLGPDADYYYAYARDAADLDVCATAEHEVHLEARESTRKFNEPGRFVTLWGYEWYETDPYRLDRNIYFRDEDCPIPEGWPATIDGFWKSIAKYFGDNKDHRVIVGPHMFTYKTTCRPWYETWDPRYERFAEIYSSHGMSEYYGNPRMLAGGNVQENYFVQDGLKHGRRFGVIASSDTHDSHPGRGLFGPQRGGLVAFLAKDLTRESIWDAFWNRRVYAATTDRIYIDFKIDGHAMGEEFKASGKLKISYTVHGCDDRLDVFLIKNNDVIRRPRTINGKIEESFMDNDYSDDSFYYLRVVQDDGEWAWSSPIWVDKD
ncbi:MAG: CehA/McbA family metallohydrolase domain-containing protein [Armatimonadota bacterium]